jgi:hypothetical protein
MGMATDMKNLTQDIVGSYDVRVQRVATLASETAEMLKGFQKENEERANEERAKEVGKMLTGFHKAHQEMAEELRDCLAKGEATRLKEHSAMMKGIQTRQKEREGEVASMLGAFRDEREKMAAEWQNLTSMMINRRSGRYKPRPKGEMGKEAMEPKTMINQRSGRYKPRPKGGMGKEAMEPKTRRRRRRKG